MAAAFEFVRVKSLSAKTTGASSTDAVIQVCAEHNLRQGHCHSRDKESGPIDPARSHLNVVLRGCDKAVAVAQMARDLVQVGGWQKDYERSNGAVAGELVFSLPANTQLDVAAFFIACIVWAEQYFDAPALSAVVHLDQGQPHCHLIFLNVRGGQWRGGRFFGDRDAIKAMRADFHAAVGKPHGLRRQQQFSETTAIRHATAMREFDAIMAHQGCLNDPVVRQALISLIAADPEQLRTAREHAMAVDEMPIALPNMAAPVDKTQVLSCVALSPDDASIDAENAIDAGQGVVVEPIRIGIPACVSLSLKDSDEPPEHLVRVRDADLPAECWNADQGEFIELPLPRPSARELAMRDIHSILGMRQRRQDDRVSQMATLLDPKRFRAGQDDHQLDAAPETMLDAA